MMKSRVEKFVKQLVSSPRLKVLLLMLVGGSAIAFAQNSAGDYSGWNDSIRYCNGGNSKVCALCDKTCVMPLPVLLPL